MTLDIKVSAALMKYNFLEQNKFFDASKAHQNKTGFTNPYLAKEFEKKKFIDLVKMVRENRHDPVFEK